MLDLKNFSLPELKKLSVAVQKELDRRTLQSKKALIKQVQQMAAEHGLDADEMLAEVGLSGREGASVKSGAGKAAPGRKKKAPAVKKEKLPPVYWNPVNAQEGWSGHGRRPSWVITYLENGGELESLKKRP